MRLRNLSAIGCILFPAALAAQSPAAAPADVQGRVVDAASGAPVEGALVELRNLGRRAVADSSGRFTFARVPSGTHQWVISRVGYARWEESTEVEDGDEFTIALLARPQVLEGITAVASQLQHRREVSGVAVRTLERTTLRMSAAPSAFEMVGDHLGIKAVPCPPDPNSGADERNNNRPRRGNEEAPRRNDPGPNQRGTQPAKNDQNDAACAWIRGALTRPVVYIDEQRANGGLGDLLNVRPQDLFILEAYSGGQMIRLITVPYAERVARGRADLMPLSF